ncbi:aminotransferase-like domain-containing protein [Halomonas sp. BC04]|uniref:aminotransferase-like domain-containing protein n=1 Tax=Halomonas sp. BC04 TaxID=1403540 RepID=UPI0003ED7265|nr:PLP-dependent aminotransferase family protein [Halomonas sp. BC04]EWG98655.1 hypothetical protein Q427_29555 [Halomonas sp. BC04]
MREDRSPLIYEGIAKRTADLIRSGMLRSGDRLPSLRQVSRQNHVSLATAIQAYRWLEERDLIFARPGSGFFVTYGEHGTAMQGEAGAVMLSADSRPYDTASELWLPPRPASGLLPEHRLSRLIGAMVRRHPSMINYETGPAGDHDLRSQIARRATSLGLDCHPEDIVVTSGGLEAITLALRAVSERGDAIAVESPCSAATLSVLRSLGLVPMEVDATREHGIHLGRLDEMLTTRDIRACLFATNCSDPLSYVMSDASKRDLMRILARHGVPLIENDILGDLAYGERPSPAAAFAVQDNTQVCSSFTYTLGAGLRLGWLAPGKYLARVLELKAASSVSPPPLIQCAVADYLQGSGFERHLRALRRALELRTEVLAQAVSAYFPPATRLYPPAGGSSMWIELPPSSDACSLWERSPGNGIDWVPGCRFTTSRTLCDFMRIPATEVRGHAMDARITALGTQVKRMSF